MTKGVSLSWPSWAGLAIGLIGTAVTNYVLIMGRITAVEVRQEYAAKSLEKSEKRLEDLTAAVTMRFGGVVRSSYHEEAAAAPAAPAE